MAIIFLVMALFYLIKRPKIKRLEAGHYPGVPAGDFERWKRSELLSIDVFVGAVGLSVVCFALQLAIAFAADNLLDRQTAGSLALWMIVGQIGLFFLGLVVSAVYGSIAAGLRKRLGIVVPS